MRSCGNVGGADTPSQSRLEHRKEIYMKSDREAFLGATGAMVRRRLIEPDPQALTVSEPRWQVCR